MPAGAHIRVAITDLEIPSIEEAGELEDPSWLAVEPGEHQRLAPRPKLPREPDQSSDTGRVDEATVLQAEDNIALRALRTRGPVTAGALAERYGLTAADVEPTLERLVLRGVVRRDAFTQEREDGRAPATPQYLHIAVLDEIQRRQVHARRVPRPTATAEQFAAFLLRRHHLHPEHRLVGPPGVLAALELLQGEDFPVKVWEQDLLSARVEDYQREWLDRLGLAGEIVWTVFEPVSADTSRTGRVGVALSDNVGWLREAGERELDPKTKNVLRHLQLRGASFARDLARGAGLEPPQVEAALWDLFRAGLTTPDTFSAIVAATAPHFAFHAGDPAPAAHADR